MPSEHITVARLLELARLDLTFTQAECRHLSDCDECAHVLRVFWREVLDRGEPPNQSE